MSAIAHAGMAFAVMALEYIRLAVFPYMRLCLFVDNHV